MKICVINNFTKEYPDMIKITVMIEPQIFIKTENTKRRREEVKDSEYHPSVSSLSRTKSLIRDIVVCNDFEWFATFTFDPKKVDRFSYARCYQKMSTWIHHQANLSREAGKKFRYLVIPEQHKNGAWHFHALFSGYVSTMKKTALKTPQNNEIWNITSFRSGFTTASPINKNEGWAVGNYVSKYITKAFIKQFNRRRFFCSRDLVRPKRITNSKVLDCVLPIFKRPVLKNAYTEQYIIDKSTLPRV